MSRFSLFILLVITLANVATSCPFAGKSSLRGAMEDKHHRHLLAKKPHVATQAVLPPGVCARGKAVVSTNGIRYVYQAVKKEFNALIENSTRLERANIFGTCLRLAFHDAGEVDLRAKDKLGPDGCLSKTLANKGLIEADSIVMTVIEPMWQKYCDRISRADFWALMGKVAAERADPTRTLNIPFQYGRKDNLECNAGANRLPGHQEGISEFNRVFVQQMKLTMYDAVTLLGAHSVGHVHFNNTGFGLPDNELTGFADNAWDETPDRLDNQYYKAMILDTWQNTRSRADPSKNTWFIPKKKVDGEGALVDETYHANNVMLNADMVIGFPIRTDYDPVAGGFVGVEGEMCGDDIVTGAQYGCRNQFGEVAGWPFETYDQALKYTQDNAIFLRDFAASYMRMTTVGYRIQPGPIKDSKLGNLKAIDLGLYFDPLPFDVSPYGIPTEICPKVEGASYSVDGFPSSPYMITPFQDTFRNPPNAIPKHKKCRADGHCIVSYEFDVKDVRARPFDNAVPQCKAQNATWFLTYGGSAPGATITVPSGHESVVRFNNKISDARYEGNFKPCTGDRKGRPFSVHFHGSASLAPYDGWADDETCGDETKDYVYPNNRPNTGWYHDHAVHITAENAYNGLAGFYVISAKKKHGGCGEPWNLEDIEEKLMMINDRVLDSQCQSRMDITGVHKDDLYGDINMVNGIPYPDMPLEPKTYRFRLLNAAVSRPFLIKIKTLSGEDVSSSVCHVIASDGGYRTNPISFPSSGLLMGVAERYEVVCDFSSYRGKTLIMWNENDYDQMKDVPYFCFSHLVARLTIGQSTSVSNPPQFNPTMGNPDPSLIPLKKVLSDEDMAKAVAMAERGEYHRRMDFGKSGGKWTINGETWDTYKIAAADVGHNTWELWEFRTGGGWFHPIHMHLVDFYVIKRNGANGVRTFEQAVPKDVFYLGPSNDVFVIARFGAHKGDYMFHCHNLMHEDNDMMRAMHVGDSEDGKTAETAAKFVANPLNHIIYGNYKYADPMLGETAAKPSTSVATFDETYVQSVLEKNLYRIFYPLPEDLTLMAGYENPWQSRVCAWN